jgi:DNA-binding NtrC family response regulator
MTAPGATRAPSARVLVVDDERDHRELIAAKLRAVGYGVTMAHDGRELLDILFTVPRGYFAAVVCDQMMPTFRGTECLARASSRAPFVIVSAASDPTIASTATGFGAAAFFRKPVDLDELTAVIDALTSPTTAKYPIVPSESERARN